MRILWVRPCCIGDVVVATAALSAVRDAYPDAHITWAVGSWSRKAIEYHAAVDDILDTGAAALPVKSWGGFWSFVNQMRTGNYDMVISLVRSPLMSLAVLLSGIEQRVGMDSHGRGFGYNIKLPLDPNQARHEAQIYLDVVAQLGIDTSGYQVNLPVLDSARETVTVRLEQQGIHKPYIVINPAGGSNPGMLMDSKRFPPQQLAQVANVFATEYDVQIVLLAGPDDGALVKAVTSHLTVDYVEFVGTLSFSEIGALAAGAQLYLGNDTGLTHLAAASGAKAAMILGPSDPIRYAPFTEKSIALWKATQVTSGGVARADTASWDWARDGISVDEVVTRLREFLG